MNGPYDIYTDTGESDHAVKICSACNSEMIWAECLDCSGIGGFDSDDLMEDDPLWYEGVEWESCQDCEGKGGWWECPNAANHKSHKDPNHAP